MEQAVKTLVLAVIGAYKRVVSPMLLPACRYVPTCSEYAMEAVELHGVLRGGALALWRLLRCHPFAKGGVDLVPAGRDCRTGAPQHGIKVCSH